MLLINQVYTGCRNRSPDYSEEPYGIFWKLKRASVFFSDAVRFENLLRTCVFALITSSLTCPFLLANTHVFSTTRFLWDFGLLFCIFPESVILISQVFEDNSHWSVRMGIVINEC